MDHVSPRPVGDTSAFFQAIAGTAVAALVMFGVGGTAYNLFAPGKWLAQLFERSLAGGIAAILALLIVGLCVKLTHDLISTEGRNRYAEFFAYGFAAVGTAYALQYLVKGAL